jgi:hypothetical protein
MGKENSFASSIRQGNYRSKNGRREEKEGACNNEIVAVLFSETPPPSFIPCMLPSSLEP